MPDKPVSVFTLTLLALRELKLAIGIFLALACFCFGAYFVSASKADRLDAHGVTTKGRVAAVTTSTVYRDGERHLQDRTVLTFKTEDGAEVKQTITGRPYKPTRTHSRVGARYETGQELTVRYMPENPNVYEIGEGRSRKSSAGDLRLMYLILGIAVLPFLNCFWKGLMAVRTRDRGKTKRVKVCHPPDETSEFERRNKVFWKLDKNIIGRSFLVKDKSKKLQPGESITVYVDGKRSCWEGDVGPPKSRPAKPN